jgi:glutathione synthase/RimK-type ligase-like ATP-grasp enzyme
MSEISLLYDRSETDEQGIRLTAENMGIKLGFLPFHKIVIGLTKDGLIYRSKGRNLKPKFDDVKVILNRTQAKNRRILSTGIMESLGKSVINPQAVEETCRSKIQTLIKFYKKGVKIPNTMFFPCNTREPLISGGFQDNIPFILDLTKPEIGEDVVIKPDEGTHGTGIHRSHDRDYLKKLLIDNEPGIINPVGVFAQEYVNKWFFDLRIIIEKRNGEPPFCHPTAMARGGFQDFRTNTFLGNMVFRIDLPKKAKESATKCGEAVGKNSKSYVLALDAMPRFKEPLAEIQEQLIPSYNELESYFAQVIKAKKMKGKAFPEYTRLVEEAYEEYMESEPYNEIMAFISDSLESKMQELLFHEANSCPDFWEQTRIVGGVNIAESLLKCALSLL